MLEVKRLRQEREWNQTELAYHAGLAPSVISQIENGKRDPSSRTLRKLAEAFGVEVGDLFPKAQAPLPDFGSEQRASVLAKAITVASERWSTVTADGTSDPGQAFGIMTVALDLKTLLGAVMEDAEFEQAWERIPPQEKRDIEAVMDALGQLTQGYRARQAMERSAVQKRTMMRQWTQEVAKSA